MTPLDFAEKWARVAFTLWTTHDDSQPNVYTLKLCAQEHYGSRPYSITDLMAVASLQAMNEWEQYKATR